MRDTVRRGDIKIIERLAGEGVSAEAISMRLQITLERIGAFMPRPPPEVEAVEPVEEADEAEEY